MLSDPKPASPHKHNSLRLEGQVSSCCSCTVDRYPRAARHLPSAGYCPRAEHARFLQRRTLLTSCTLICQVSRLVEDVLHELSCRFDLPSPSPPYLREI
eukprot:6212038-Pleurochrysis_carterae.AAC.2